MNDYYKKEQVIGKIDETGKIIGEIEKWEAHRKGILHKALTIALIYKDQFVIQKRKHPAFDNVLDVTSSSHQLIINGKLQTTEEAVYDCLKREWGLEINQISSLKNLGSIYYQAKDPNSEFAEHEMCDILVANLNVEPKPNLDFAYGFLLAGKQELEDKDSEIYSKLAPWVKIMIEENKL